MSDIKKVAIAEAVIDLAVKIGAEQDLRLGEVIGHLEIAKMELYNRNVAMAKSAQAQAQADKAKAERDALVDSIASEPSEDGDTQEPEASSQGEDEGKGEN